MTGNGRKDKIVMKYPLTCNICEEIFVTISELKEHKRDAHAY